MKNIIFALIALNLLYFLWPRENQAPQTEFTRGQANLSMLVTLDETDQQPSRTSVVTSTVDAAVIAARKTDRLVTAAPPAPVVDAAEPEPAPKPVPEETADPAPEQLEIAQVTPEISAPEPEPTAAEIPPEPEPEVAAAEPQGAVQKLDTATPLMQAQIVESDTPIVGLTELTPPDDSSEAPTPIKECYTLGPLKDKKSLNKALNLLSDLGALATTRTASERRIRGYWVYLPPRGSREEALSTAEELGARGFNDYFVVAGGEHDNSISLGLFTLKNGSERRQKRILDMGFSPKIQVRYSEVTIYWLDYEIDKIVDWAAFMNQHYPSRQIEQIKRSCT